MMKSEMPHTHRAIIQTIEEYRGAYWAHRDLSFVLEHRYKALVSLAGNNTSNFSVVLYDTWVNGLGRGSFCMGKKAVDGSCFYSSSLQSALESLLKFTRQFFYEDHLFKQICS